MIFFEPTSLGLKKLQSTIPRWFKALSKREAFYLLFLLVICLFYLARNIFTISKQQFQVGKIVMEGYEERLKANLYSKLPDTLIALKEREQLLRAIEERIVIYLYQVPDYSKIDPLETYLKIRPQLLEQFPSVVPLEKGDYRLSSRYGMRPHPIYQKAKNHYGIDLAAPSGKPVYASAYGTVIDVIHSKKGYGSHIIIAHRFGFQTLYGHLDKVLVKKGQKIGQHELIGTVGNTGNTTGYHLHYEILKNDIKIDPKASLNLKKKIFTQLIPIKNELRTVHK